LTRDERNDPDLFPSTIRLSENQRPSIIALRNNNIGNYFFEILILKFFGTCVAWPATEHSGGAHDFTCNDSAAVVIAALSI
jgi:hypothetical protein